MRCDCDYVEVPNTAANVDPQMFTRSDQKDFRRLVGNKTQMEQLVRRVAKEYLHRKPNADLIATHFCVSTRTLGRYLANSGLSFREIIADIRSEATLKYLHNTDMSISEISRTLGYSSTSNFVKAFKQWLGCCPGEYRRNRLAS